MTTITFGGYLIFRQTHTGSYSTTIFELPWLECVCVLFVSHPWCLNCMFGLCAVCIYIYIYMCVCVYLGLYNTIYTHVISIFLNFIDYIMYIYIYIYTYVYYLCRHEISVHIHIHASIHTIPYLNIT